MGTSFRRLVRANRNAVFSDWGGVWHLYRKVCTRLVQGLFAQLAERIQVNRSHLVQIATTCFHWRSLKLHQGTDELGEPRLSSDKVDSLQRMQYIVLWAVRYPYMIFCWITVNMSLNRVDQVVWQRLQPNSWLDDCRSIFRPRDGRRTATGRSIGYRILRCVTG